MRLHLIGWIALAVLATGLRPAAAAVESATVQVDGLTCPFCAYGLEKQLKRLDGVESVTIDIDAGLAALQLADTVRLTNAGNPDNGLIAAMREAVKAGGFTPRELRITASGRLETAGDATEMVLSGTAERVAVDINALDRQVPEGPLHVAAVVRVDEGRLVLEVQQLLRAEAVADEEEGS